MCQIFHYLIQGQVQLHCCSSGFKTSQQLPEFRWLHDYTSPVTLSTLANKQLAQALQPLTYHSPCINISKYYGNFNDHPCTCHSQTSWLFITLSLPARPVLPKYHNYFVCTVKLWNTVCNVGSPGSYTSLVYFKFFLTAAFYLVRSCSCNFYILPSPLFSWLGTLHGFKYPVHAFSFWHRNWCM